VEKSVKINVLEKTGQKARRELRGFDSLNA